MDEKEAEARPVMGTIFLVIIPFVLCTKKCFHSSITMKKRLQ